MSVPELQGIQWVQGMADDYQVMQHLVFIKYVQSINRNIIVELAKEDLNEYMEKMSPKNTFFWIATKSNKEFVIMKKVEKWSRKH